MAPELAAPLVFTVPMLTAAVLGAVGRWLPRRLIDVVAAACAACVLGLSIVLLAGARHGTIVTYMGGWRPVHGESVGIVLSVDPFGAGLVLLAAALVLASLVYSWRYFESIDALYHTLLLLFLAGMCGFAVSGDLFDMFVFFELMGAVAFALTGYRIEDPNTVQGALHFGVVNSLGAYVSLTGIALLYARTNELGLAQIGLALEHGQSDALVTVSFALVMTGFLVKAAAVPFHFWTADAEGVAPSPVCALFSCVMVELGVYGVARVYWVAYSGGLAPGGVSHALLVIGAATALIGGIMCLQQHDIKRLLAYSTISHVGLFLLGVGLLTPDGLAGAAVYVVGHAGAKGALFLGAGMLLNRLESVDVRELHGAGRRGMRAVAAIFVIGGLGLAGLPPFGTFLGKSGVEDALIADGQMWAVPVVVLATSMTAGAVFAAALRVFAGAGRRPREADAWHERRSSKQRETGGRLRRVPLTMLTPPILLLAGSVLFNLVPGVGGWAAAAAGRFVDRAGITLEVIHGLAGRPPAPVVPPEWTATGIALGITSTVLALAWAGLRVWGYRLPTALRTAAWTATGRPTAALVRIHSERLGDSVAWLVVGVAVLAGLVAL